MRPIQKVWINYFHICPYFVILDQGTFWINGQSFNLVNKVCEREREQTTSMSEGEGSLKCLPYIMNEIYLVKVSIKVGLGLKYSKFCQRGLYTPSNGKSKNYRVPRSGVCNDKL